MLVGRRHARHFTDLEGTPQQPGPHALVLFFRRGLAGPHDEVLIASRMFLRGDDVVDLTAVVETLCERADEYRQLGAFDPLVHLTDRAEPMASSGQYLGVGTSSLRPEQCDPAGLPWYGLADLVDGTQLRMSRPPGDAVGTVVASTHTLDSGVALSLSPYTWQWASRQPLDIATRGAADALGRLNQLLVRTQADSAFHRHRSARQPR